jgi:hypothetical protein
LIIIKNIEDKDDDFDDYGDENDGLVEDKEEEFDDEITKQMKIEQNLASENRSLI